VHEHTSSSSIRKHGRLTAACAMSFAITSNRDDRNRPDPTQNNTSTRYRQTIHPRAIFESPTVRSGTSGVRDLVYFSLTATRPSRMARTEYPERNNSRRTGSRPGSSSNCRASRYSGPRQRWSALIRSRNQFWQKVVRAPSSGTKITTAAAHKGLQARIDIHSSC